MKRYLVLALLVITFSFTGAPSPGNFLKLSTANAATKAQWKKARRICRKKYGKRLVKTAISANGRLICTFRKVSKNRGKHSYEDVRKYCAKKYSGYASARAIKRFGKWYCQTRQ